MKTEKVEETEKVTVRNQDGTEAEEKDRIMLEEISAALAKNGYKKMVLLVLDEENPEQFDSFSNLSDACIASMFIGVMRSKPEILFAVGAYFARIVRKDTEKIAKN